MSSSSPSRLRVVEHDPRRAWRVGVLIGVLWFCSLAALYFFVRSTLAPQLGQVSKELGVTQAALVEAQTRASKLEVNLAKHERGQQVAERAAQDLQLSLAARQDEIASLRNDLGFYQRLMEVGSQQAGITVHSFEAQPTEQTRAFQFALTLSQNLKRNRVTSGKVEITISGTDGERGLRLGMDKLGGESATMGFSFKYFQRLSGVLMLPEDFTPASVRVKVIAENASPVEREFVWKEVIAISN